MILKKPFLACIGVFLAICAHADQSTTTSSITISPLNSVGSKDSPLVIDMEGAQTITINTEQISGKTGYVAIKNVNPMQLELYSVTSDNAYMAPADITYPVTSTTKSSTSSSSSSASSSADNTENLAKTTACKADEIDQIFKQTDKVSDATALARSHIAESKATDKTACEAKLTSLLQQSTLTYSFDIRNGETLTITVHYRNTANKLAITVKPTEWITHVGFSFLNSRNREYYSKEVPGSNGAASHYVITPQQNQSSIDYAATVMFTYPLSYLGAGIQLGSTAGLAADNTTIAALAGLSLIFNTNVSLTGGVLAKQFDGLNGRYTVGQDLGTTAVDSSQLVSKEYRTSYFITLGFKFH